MGVVRGEVRAEVRGGEVGRTWGKGGGECRGKGWRVNGEGRVMGRGVR